MRIAAIGHSLVHMRQWLFFRELAAQGHEVLMVAPERWHHLELNSHTAGTLTVKTLPVTNMGDIYHFGMVGAREFVEKFRPDWVYLMQEAQSDLAAQVPEWAPKAKKAIFVWENIQAPGEREKAILKSYDLIVCGNHEAHNLIVEVEVANWKEQDKPCSFRTAILPQVGIDLDLLKPVPGVQRSIDVAFLGRPVPEKGIDYLMLAWPQTMVLPWADYQDLPRHYSQAKVVVVYSQDTANWKEQAMPYVAIEALACGAQVIVSDTDASVFWLFGCPDVTFVPQKSPARLREDIQRILDRMTFSQDPKYPGREWVRKRFSNQVVTGKLLKAFGKTESLRK